MKEYITDYSHRYPLGSQQYVVNHAFDDVKDPKVLSIPKQQRLIRLLAEGCRLTEAAEKIGVPIETAKLYLDTREHDTNRRKDMVRRGVCIPVKAVNVETGEERLFQSIKECSEFIDKSSATIRKALETGAEINGYKLQINE